MKQQAINNLIEKFQQREAISREELFEYFRTTEGELKKSTFAWRLYDLRQQNVLRQTKKGWYSLQSKSAYRPVINAVLEKMAVVFASSFKETRYCVWDLNWINEFAVHQFTKEEYLLETEKDLEESAAHVLSDNGFQNILWNLRGTHVSIINSVDPIIILPLISRAPVQYLTSAQGYEVAVPTLEKLLVDIFIDDRVFYFVRGAETERIYENALKRYSINMTTLLAYAKRRGKEPEIREYIQTNFPEIPINEKG